jgi:Metal-dependent hydrolase
MLLLVFLFLCLPYAAYADTQSVKILTLNLHDGLDEKGRNSLLKTLAFFEAENPDIISLQEVEPGLLKTFQAAGYQVITGMNHNLFSYHFGNAILTRHKIIYHRHHYLPSSKEQRGLDEAAIEFNGISFIILNTHLGLGRPEQQQQFEEVQRIITYLHAPFILCGDFNVPVSDSLFTEFKKNFNEIGRIIPIPPSFPTSNPKERLDQIWYSQDWQPQEAQTIAWDGSDHLPVEAEFKLNTASSNSVTKEDIPEVTQDNNPLLPNVGQSLPPLSLIINPADKENKICGSINLPLTNGIRFSGEYDDSGFTPALYYHVATFDLRDYFSKWKIRGKAEWDTAVTAGPDDEPWLTWEQYYRWSERTGTKINISNKNDEINCNIEQVSLFSSRFGCALGWDTQQQLSLGVCFTPDRRNAIEIRWYPDDPDLKWQVRWSYQ